MSRLSKEELERLREISKRIAEDVLIMTTLAGSGHPGGSLSIRDIITVLLFHVMRYDFSNPSWPDRDRLVLSKGHGAPALYAALVEAGVYDRSYLAKLRRPDSPFEGHPVRSAYIEASTGSLGNGFSFAVGMALAGKIDKRNYRVYVILGDGELQEGIVWEAAMAASHYRLDNLIAIVDRNGLQIDGPTEQVMSIEPLRLKWEAFGWETYEVDGHDIEALASTLEKARDSVGRPKVVIAHTTKGKGVPWEEWEVSFHGKPLKREELQRAIEALERGESVDET